MVLLPTVDDTNQEMMTVTGQDADLSNTNSKNNNMENEVVDNDSAEDDNNDPNNDDEDNSDFDDGEDNGYMVPVAFEEPAVVTSVSAPDCGQNVTALSAGEQHKTAKRNCNQRVVVSSAQLCTPQEWG